ncbi:hypothetical protein LGM90_00455 [Burkholderia sp. AU28942]|uniref:hypothetical protein n=1 Tax=Burkholderia TaxID=32008 RepID=UPI0012E9D0E5|nr:MULTISPECIES: hypothetical protein [Burkholderia]MCA8306994.1 hypothetical protein [Burkholderia sp. AU28942]
MLMAYKYLNGHIEFGEHRWNIEQIETGKITENYIQAAIAGVAYAARGRKLMDWWRHAGFAIVRPGSPRQWAGGQRLRARGTLQSNARKSQRNRQVQRMAPGSNGN